MAISEDSDAFAAVLTDAAGLPYAVRTRGLDLVNVIILCAMGLMLGGVGADQIWRGSGPLPPLMLLACLAAGAAALWRLWRLRTPYAVFHPDRLEIRGLTGWRVLRRSDVQGLRPSGGDRAGALFELVPRQSGARGVLLREALRKDPVVARWLKGAPDLNAQAVAADRSAILGDTRYGATEAERAARLKTARTVALVFNLACVAAAAGMIVTPGGYPVDLALAVAAPLAGAGLVRAFNGLIVWNAAGRSRPSILGALAPAGAAAYRATELQLLHAQVLVAAAALVGVGAAAIAAALRPADPRWRAATGLFFIGGFAAYGLAALTDVALAPPGETVFARTVTDRFVSGSRYPTYHLRVEAWGDQPTGPITVPRAYYERTGIGAIVCIARRHGSLGLDWYAVADCPAGSQPTAQTAAVAPAAAGSASYYPKAAMAAGKEGLARVKCAVDADLTVSGCQVVSETPPGLGFGPAAIERVTRPDFHLKAAEVRGRTTVIVPVAFKLSK